jgi:hypothetical protein
MTSSMRKAIPSFAALPLRKGDPPFSAWGLWENPGLGTLNYLTSEVVLKTMREEVNTGERVGLKYVVQTSTSSLWVYNTDPNMAIQSCSGCH